MNLHEIIKTLQGIPVEYVKSQGNLRWTEFTTPVMARNHSITWMDDGQHTLAGCIITQKKLNTGATQIITDNPRMVFNLLMKKFSTQQPESVIDPTAVIHPEAVLGRFVKIGAYSVIGKCFIGDMTTVYSHCFIGNGTHIGRRCEIWHGAVIGTDGFEYDNYNGEAFKVYSQCHIYIGDDVTIGANTCVNRGILSDTVIFNGAKIGNLCHLNHEVRIEENTLIGPRTCVMSNIQNVRKIPVSILIPAYNAQDFIEEALDSIEKQTYFSNNDNYEVLVGVDACQKTLDKLNAIRSKYRNLRIYMMGDNQGPYVTLNTLSEKVKYAYLLPFGADDIMKPEMVGEMMSKATDMVKCYFLNFTDRITGTSSVNRYASHGIFLMRRSLLRAAGGFRPWRCGGDTEMMKRISSHANVYEIKTPLFYRRLHEASLTQNKTTGAGSDTRKQYQAQVRVYGKEEDIRVEKVVNTCRKVGSKNKIAVCIPIYKRPEITDFVMNHYWQLKQKLSDEMELVLICAGSEGKVSKKLARKNHFAYIEAENTPLSQKANMMYAKAQKLSVDACIKVDSDSIVSGEFFHYYDDLIDRGYDYSGIEDIYFVLQDYVCYFSGYKNKRKGETIGVGRFLSRKLLDELSWRPWGDLTLDMGLDTNLDKIVKKKPGMKITKTRCDIIDGICVDLKSRDVGITSFDRCVFDSVKDVKEIGIDFSSIVDFLLKKDKKDIKIY